MRFRVLGQVDVERDGSSIALGGPQQRRLLALLLSERGRVVTTGRIVEALWAGGESPDAASRSAMKYVSRLRAALGDAVIVTVGSGYRLELNGHGCDIDEFEALVDGAGREVPDVAVERYGAALELWRGPPYGEFNEEWWALPEASRLAERRVAAEVARAATYMAMGHHNRAIPELERLALECPLDERPVRLLMQGLNATGRQAEALRVGRDFRRRLVSEAGLDPSSALGRLEAEIAGGVETPGSSAGSPLRGYTIHDAIGEGAHGRVHVATQPGTGRRVAIKVIRPDLADSTEFVRRFDAEAQLVARLEHPHIVPLYDYWREPGGAYLVFRLLSGGTARDSTISGGPWSLPRVSRLVEEIGGALMCAHGAGVTHNDVKASNVLLDDDGAAYLSDFGIAVVAEHVGVGVDADISGLGWLTWELLSGSRPPRTTPRSSLGAANVVGGVPSLVGRITSVPDGLDAVLRRAVGGGYSSIAEFVLAWRSVVGDAGSRHSPTPSDARRAAARRLASAATAGANPYRGLRAFDEADATTFHGRGRAVAELVELVAVKRFVAVVGSSGSGKSSAVHAGLVPLLRADGAVVVTMLPADRPIDALHTALREVATAADAFDPSTPASVLADVARRAGRMIVVVDQFEECWTRAEDEQRNAFLDIVAGAATDESIDVRFVTAVRADLLDRPLEHPKIGVLLGAGSYVLAPLSASELEDAIVQPAARSGVVFEDGIVADLIAEAVTFPGSLPLLQFTLTELYDRRRDDIIGRDALEGIGGIAGAVGRRAEEVFAGLGDALRPQARELFGRLVTPGRAAPDTRRRARFGELSAGMRDVVDRFVDARLLVADRDPTTREPTIEVAHEALLTRWSRLVDWIEDDRRWLMQLQHLAAAARAWDDAGRLDAELYRGSRLEAAIEALGVEGRAVSELEQQYVEAGRHARDAEIRAARRSQRRLRRMLVAVAATLVVALAAGALAIVQRRQANEHAADARAQAERAAAAAVDAEIEALVGRAESLRETQRDTAALLAVEAHRLADTPRTRSALLGTFTDPGGFYDARHLGRSAGAAGIVMPDGATAFVVDDAGRVHPYGLDTGSFGDPWPAIGDAPDGVSVLAASADSRWLAHARRPGFGVGPTTIGVFDTATGTPSFHPFVVDGAVWSATFTADAAELALAVGEDARLLVVDRATGDERATAPGVTLPPLGGIVAMEPRAGDAGPVRRPPAVAATAEGDLVLGAADGSLRVFDAATFELRRTHPLAADTLSSIRQLADGTLLTAGRGGWSRVDPDSGRLIWQHEQGLSSVGDGASGATCTHLAVVEQLGTFYCGNAYGRLAEHDLGSGHAIRVLDAQNGNTGSLWVARDGTELVSFGDNELLVSRWRLDGSGPITRVVAPGFRAWAFSPQGDLLIVERGRPDEGSNVSDVIDVESGEVVRRLDGLANPDWLDDDTLTGVIVNDSGQVETAHLDLVSGDLVAGGLIVDPRPDSANGEPGKQRTLVVYRDGTDATLTHFDWRTERSGPMIPIDGYVSSAISRSGHRVAAGTERGIEIYDGVTGDQFGSIAGADLRGVFITVTDQLFVSSLGGQLTQYDLDTLAPIRSFGGSRGYINQLRGSADGTLIATNGGDHTVILYDVASGVRIGSPIVVPDDESNWIALSLDGRWLAIGGEAHLGDDSAQIWDLDPEHWRAAACRVAGRNLTREEWASNIGTLAAYRATCPDFPSEE